MKQPTLDDMLAQCVEEGECLLWPGRVTSTGHPTYCGHGMRVLVRRAVFEALHGWLPEDNRSVVSTSCSSPLCVNGEHLVCVSRSRLVARSYSRRNLAAEYGKRQAALVRAGKAKLNLETARQIRCDERTHAQIAAALGVSSSLVAKIRQGQIWREPAGVFSGLLQR